MTQFTHRIVLIVPAGAAYLSARGAMASVTGEEADATATWRVATDGTLDADGAPIITHRVCNTLARASTVAALPMLQTQIGGSYHVLERARGTPQSAVLTTLDAALLEEGLWLLVPVEDPETGEPTGALAARPSSGDS